MNNCISIKNTRLSPKTSTPFRYILLQIQDGQWDAKGDL